MRNRLTNRGPGGRLQPPAPTLLHLLVGVVLRRRTRPLHREDLANLKRDVEAHAG